MNIVLYEPQIPQNTGNIARTCSVTGAHLHLIGPYGFSITASSLKRAGLDYWDALKVQEYDGFDSFLSSNPNARVVLASSHASVLYTSFAYDCDDFLLFGSETSGVPASIHDRYSDSRVKIPMVPLWQERCLNLSNSVAIVLYEALRQQNFSGLG